MVVARLHELAPHLDGEPDPAFRAATRARLVAMAAVRTPEPEPATGIRRLLAARAPDSAPARRRSRLTAGLAGAAMAVTALATLVAVSTDARPGDALYGLKRGTEQTQLALAGDARGQTLLDLAATRLDELEGLADADPALVLDTARTMDDQTTEGAAWLTERAVTTEDPAPLEDLAVWTAEQSDELAALTPTFPGGTAEAAQASLVLLSDITTRVTGLRSAIDCAGGPAVNGTDALGPVPGLCAPEQAATPPGGSGTTTSTAPVPGAPAPSLPPATTTSAVPQPGGQSGGTGAPAVGGGPVLFPARTASRCRRTTCPCRNCRCRSCPTPPSRTCPDQGAGGGASPPSAPVTGVPSPVGDAVPPAAGDHRRLLTARPEDDGPSR